MSVSSVTPHMTIRQPFFISLLRHHYQRYLLVSPSKPGMNIAQVGGGFWASNSEHSNGSIKGEITVSEFIQPLTYVGIPGLIKQSASSTQIQQFKESMLDSVVWSPSADTKSIFQLNMYKSKLVTH